MSRWCFKIGGIEWPVIRVSKEGGGLADYWCRSFSSFPFDWCVLLKFWFVLSSSNRFVAELVVCFVLVGVSFGELRAPVP